MNIVLSSPSSYSFRSTVLPWQNTNTHTQKYWSTEQENIWGLSQKIFDEWQVKNISESFLVSLSQKLWQCAQLWTWCRLMCESIATTNYFLTMILSTHLPSLKRVITTLRAYQAPETPALVSWLRTTIISDKAMQGEKKCSSCCNHGEIKTFSFIHEPFLSYKSKCTVSNAQNISYLTLNDGIPM